jgi:hypothetical protein
MQLTLGPGATAPPQEAETKSDQGSAAGNNLH